MEQAVNTFQKGLQLDSHPMMQGNESLTDCLNGTFITQNGNEITLQNDMGNARVDHAYLPAGYEPVGIKEYGGVIYVACHNPLTGKSQVGSFPSPERIKGTEYNLGNCICLDNIISSNNTQGEDKKFLVNDSILYPLTEDNSLHIGDKFAIYYTGENQEYFENVSNYNNVENTERGKLIKTPKNKLYTLSIGILNSQNEFVDITKSLFRFDENGKQLPKTGNDNFDFNNGYFIIPMDENNIPGILGNESSTQEYLKNRLALSDVNTYSYKLVGPLYLKQTLNHIREFTYNIDGYKENGKYTLIFTANITYNCPDGTIIQEHGDLTDFQDDGIRNNLDINRFCIFEVINADENSNENSNEISSKSSTEVISHTYDQTENLYHCILKKEYTYTHKDSSSNIGNFFIGVIVSDHFYNSPDNYDPCECNLTESTNEVIFDPNLSEEFSINLDLLGTGNIQFNGYRYFNNPNRTTLVYNTSYYKKQDEIKELVFKFKDITHVYTDRDEIVLGPYTAVNGKSVIEFDWEDSLDSTKEFTPRHVYRLNIYEQTQGESELEKVVENLHFLTTPLFNSCYNPSNSDFIEDFRDIRLGNENHPKYDDVICKKLTINYDYESNFKGELKKVGDYKISGSLIKTGLSGFTTDSNSSNAKESGSVWEDEEEEESGQTSSEELVQPDNITENPYRIIGTFTIPNFAPFRLAIHGTGLGNTVLNITIKNHNNQQTYTYGQYNLYNINDTLHVNEETGETNEVTFWHTMTPIFTLPAYIFNTLGDETEIDVIIDYYAGYVFDDLNLYLNTQNNTLTQFTSNEYLNIEPVTSNDSTELVNISSSLSKDITFNQDYIYIGNVKGRYQFVGDSTASNEYQAPRLTLVKNQIIDVWKYLDQSSYIDSTATHDFNNVNFDSDGNVVQNCTFVPIQAGSRFSLYKSTKQTLTYNKSIIYTFDCSYNSAFQSINSARNNYFYIEKGDLIKVKLQYNNTSINSSFTGNLGIQFNDNSSYYYIPIQTDTWFSIPEEILCNWVNSDDILIATLNSLSGVTNINNDYNLQLIVEVAKYEQTIPRTNAPLRAFSSNSSTNTDYDNHPESWIGTTLYLYINDHFYQLKSTSGDDDGTLYNITDPVTPIFNPNNDYKISFNANNAPYIVCVENHSTYDSQVNIEVNMNGTKAYKIPFDQSIINQGYIKGGVPYKLNKLGGPIYVSYYKEYNKETPIDQYKQEFVLYYKTYSSPSPDSTEQSTTPIYTAPDEIELKYSQTYQLDYTSEPRLRVINVENYPEDIQEFLTTDITLSLNQSFSGYKDKIITEGTGASIDESEIIIQGKNQFTLNQIFRAKAVSPSNVQIKNGFMSIHNLLDNLSNKDIADKATLGIYCHGRGGSDSKAINGLRDRDGNSVTNGTPFDDDTLDGLKTFELDNFKEQWFSYLNQKNFAFSYQFFRSITGGNSSNNINYRSNVANISGKVGYTSALRAARVWWRNYDDTWSLIRLTFDRFSSVSQKEELAVNNNYPVNAHYPYNFNQFLKNKLFAENFSYCAVNQSNCAAEHIYIPDKNNLAYLDRCTVNYTITPNIRSIDESSGSRYNYRENENSNFIMSFKEYFPKSKQEEPINFEIKCIEQFYDDFLNFNYNELTNIDLTTGKMTDIDGQPLISSNIYTYNNGELVFNIEKTNRLCKSDTYKMGSYNAILGKNVRTDILDLKYDTIRNDKDSDNDHQATALNFSGVKIAGVQ